MLGRATAANHTLCGVVRKHANVNQILAKPPKRGHVGCYRDVLQLLPLHQIAFVPLNIPHAETEFFIHREPLDKVPQCALVGPACFRAFPFAFLQESFVVIHQFFQRKLNRLNGFFNHSGWTVVAVTGRNVIIFLLHSGCWRAIFA